MQLWNVYVGNAPRVQVVAPSSMVSWLWRALSQSSGKRVVIRSAAWEAGRL